MVLRDAARSAGGAARTVLLAAVPLAAALGGADREPAAPSAAPGYAAGLVGSAHDFSRQRAGPRDLCLPCHAPHAPGEGSPATRPAPVAAVGPDIKLDASSLLCLGCHDGVLATDVYTPQHALGDPDTWAAARRPLTGHPVGVRYPPAGPGYRPAAMVTAAGQIRLPGGRIQCISCHDPHNRGGYPGMLVMPDTASRLCLSCHRI